MSKKTYSSFPEQQILQEAWSDFLKRGAFGGYSRRGSGRPTAPASEPTPVDAEEEEAPPSIEMPTSPAQSSRPTRDLKLDVEKTNIEDIALQILGLPEKPNPNKNKNANRAFKKLTAKIAAMVRDALKSDPSIGKVSVYENKNLEKIIFKELTKVLNEEK